MSVTSTRSKAAKELATHLPTRVRLLAKLIARKPATFTPDWAGTIDESFSLYTNTRTINFLQALNNCLIDPGWPFPSYINLKSHIELLRRETAILFLWVELSNERRLVSRAILFLRILCSSLIWICFLAKDGLSLGLMSLAALADATSEGNLEKGTSGVALCIRAHKQKIFRDLSRSPLLRCKRVVLREIQTAYAKRMWASCCTSIVPILDHLMRDYFGTENLSISVHVLRRALDEAKLCAKDFKPGFSISEGRGNLVRSVEEDLRLPGIFLSSFLAFAESFYAEATSNSPRRFNRHAIVHGSFDDWTEDCAAKLLTFLHLSVYVEKPLRIVLQDQKTS